MAIIDKSKAELIAKLQQGEQDSSNLKAVLDKEIRDLNTTIDLLQGKMINCDAVFESSPVAMFIIDETTNIVMVNLAAVKLCGGNEEEILQHRPGNALRCAHSSKDPRGCGYAPDCKLCNVRNGIESLIADGGNIAGAELEFNLIKNGKHQIVWMIVGVEPMIYNGSKHWCIALNDITEKRLIEEKLKEANALMRIAGGKVKLGGWSINLKENRSYWSDEVAAIHEMATGYSPSLEDAINFYAPEWRDKITKVFTDCSHKGIPFDEEMEIITASGKRRWIQTIGEPVRNETGEIVKVQGAFQDITKRKESEEELANIRATLVAAFEQSPVPMVFASMPDAKLQIINTACRELLGINDEIDPVEQKLTDFKPSYLDYDEIGNLTPLDKAPLTLALSGQVVLNQKRRIITKAGKTHWILVSATPIFSKKGNLIGAYLVMPDITQFKQTEEEFQKAKEKAEESEKRYRELLNNLTTGVVVHDADTSIILSNSRAAELLGISEDQMHGKVAMDPQWKFIFEDYTPLPLNEYPVMRIINSKNPIKNQVFGVFQSTDHIVWLIVNGFPFLDNSGEIVEIIISFVDITELKRIEEALRKNEERFNHAMKASTDGLFDWNLETNEIYYAPAWKKMLGYEDHELPNDFSVWEKTTDPEDVKKSWELQKKLISKQVDRFVLEFKMQHKDGHWVNILSRAGAIFNDTGKAIRIVGNHTDISDRKLAEKEIQKQLDELRRWYEVTINREGKVLELKKEVNELLKKSGEPVKYKSIFTDDTDVEIKT
jgi:PAS domain S-box-containing protein